MRLPTRNYLDNGYLKSTSSFQDSTLVPAEIVIQFYFCGMIEVSAKKNRCGHPGKGTLDGRQLSWPIKVSRLVMLTSSVVTLD